MANEDQKETPSSRETEWLLDRLRSKGYRVGGVQAVFGVGDSPGHLRYVVNGVPLDLGQLRALERGVLKLPEPPSEESWPRGRSPVTTP